MSPASTQWSATPADMPVGEGVAVQRDVVAVFNCHRLGRTANPPSFSLGDLFRLRRRH
jgi:hypothetical protein